MTPTAIQTRYNGYRFRSRLEARWAVFFDALDVRWEYEPQGFSLPSGPYLPDFYFPTWQSWGEVKPTIEAFDKRQAAHLAEHTGEQVLLLIGTPTDAQYGVVLPPFRHEDGWVYPRTEHVDLSLSAERGKVWIDFDDSAPSTVPPTQRFLAAVEAARSARFEHGESPTLPDPPPPARSELVADPVEAEYLAYQAEIDRRMPLASNAEKDAMTLRKVALRDEMQSLGIARRWRS